MCGINNLLAPPLLILGLLSSSALGSASHTPYQASFPPFVTLRAGILSNTVPLAYVDQSEIYSNEPFPIYRGFQPDLLRALQRIALEHHNVTLTFDITEAPPFSYLASFDLVAQDCNTTTNPHPLEECNKYEFLVGDYYAYYPRPLRAPFTPALLTTSASAIKYVHRQKRDIATLAEAEALQEPVCLHNDSFYDGQTLERYPNIKFFRCRGHAECLKWLKDEDCVLMVEDELQLRYLTVKDPELEVTRESFDEQYVLWPINSRLDPIYQQLLVTLIYRAKEMGILDELYDKFFSVNFCPVGKAGHGCALPCNPSHGVSDRFGNCVCDSTRYSGEDCSVQVEENLNLLSRWMVGSCYAMVTINFLLVFGCGLWLMLNRHRSEVKIAQPDFLLLILIGCVISTSTIIALTLEDDEDSRGSSGACMAIPWLYSIGFCITFGALFSKIRRIYLLLRSAARMQRISVSFKETALVVALVLAIDIAILVIWTILDPLEWERTITNADKYGYALESEGYCVSEHWMVFASIIATFHVLLMAMACLRCYQARAIPNRFSNGKYVAIAMFSNFQILLLCLPILFILGSDPRSAFVRAVMIWINDCAVVGLIFGPIIYKVHRWDRNKKLHPSMREDSSASIIRDLSKFAQTIRLDSQHSSCHSRRDSSLQFTIATIREESSSRISHQGVDCDSTDLAATGTDTKERRHQAKPTTNGQLNVVAEEESSLASSPSMHEDLAESLSTLQTNTTMHNTNYMPSHCLPGQLPEGEVERLASRRSHSSGEGPKKKGPVGVGPSSYDGCEESTSQQPTGTPQLNQELGDGSNGSPPPQAA